MYFDPGCSYDVIVCVYVGRNRGRERYRSRSRSTERRKRKDKKHGRHRYTSNTFLPAMLSIDVCVFLVPVAPDQEIQRSQARGECVLLILYCFSLSVCVVCVCSEKKSDQKQEVRYLRAFTFLTSVCVSSYILKNPAAALKARVKALLEKSGGNTQLYHQSIQIQTQIQILCNQVRVKHRLKWRRSR